MRLLLFIGFCLSLQTLIASPIQKVLVKGGPIQFHGIKSTINSFQISKYEITNEQYATFLNAERIGADGMQKDKLLINVWSGDLQIVYEGNKWIPKQGFENYPMVMVSYYGAVACSKWLGGQLPTEAEWYFAATGGMKTRQYKYAGSNVAEEVSWNATNSNKHSHPVGEKKPNELGICDMSGNAWEWCLNEKLKTDSDFCVHMGGSWYAGIQPSELTAHYGNIPTHFSNSVGFRVLFPVDQIVSLKNISPADYKGKPWNNQMQQIPGKIECEWYDLGGEGIAYHDQDSVNNGSGKLNPANGTFLNEFRMKEGVDISYTKSRDIDNNPYNMVEPDMGQFYVGWTMPGEWINYTVQVNQTGMYTLGMMYTASGNGGIQLLVDGKEITPELLIPSTRNDKEPIAWRQWHHWNRIDTLTTVQLTKGIHILSLQTVTNGNMNYDYLVFTLKD